MDHTFTWISWWLDRYVRIREKIRNSSEEENRKIAEELALFNLFLRRRLEDLCFRNWVYHEINQDQQLVQKIFRELMRVLSRDDYKHPDENPPNLHPTAYFKELESKFLEQGDRAKN